MIPSVEGRSSPLGWSARALGLSSVTVRVLLFIALNIVGVGILAAPYLTITP